MPRWQVQLLGGFQIREGSQVVRKFRTRTVDGLFAYLALHLGNVVRREKLLETLWPECDPRLAGQNLRTGIHNIRAVLGPEAVTGDRAVIGLNAAQFEVDALAFQESRDMSLYQGRLLEGLSGAWIWPVAQALEDAFVEAVVAKMEDSSPAEATRLGTDVLRQNSGLLAVRAKLREVGAMNAVPVPSAPAHAGSLIGRVAEMETISKLLAVHRLVTLTGQGGSGKTRIATEVWRVTQPESWFVSLADVLTPELIGDAIRERLRLPPSGRQSGLDQVILALAESRGLLVLDNFEHVSEAASVVSEILRQCPEIRVLITSRVALNIEAGVEFQVNPLALVPRGGEQVSESAQLFEARARMACPGFAIHEGNRAEVNELCRRLDGFPLALELAAAKSRLFTPKEMLAQLDDRFEFLHRLERREGRQSSLLKTLDWSFDRLSDASQDLLCRLSVFEGGFNLAAASQVCEADPGGEQIDTLLVSDWIKRSESAGRTRFRMLESVRDYGDALLPPQAKERIQLRHAEYFTGVAEACFAATYTPSEPEHFRIVRNDLANFEAAWRWQVAHDAEGMLRLANGLDWFFRQSGLSSLGEQWLKQAIERSSAEPRRLLTAAYHSCATLVLTQQRYAEAIEWSERTHVSAMATNDTRYLGLSLMQMAFARAEAGHCDIARPQSAASIEFLKTDENTNWLAAAYTVKALIGNRSGALDEARQAGQAAVDSAREGGYPWAMASALNELAMTCFLAGKIEDSIGYQLESIRIKAQLQAIPSLALSRGDLANAYLAAGLEGPAILELKAWADMVAKSQEAEFYPRAIGAAAHAWANRDARLARQLLTKMQRLCGPGELNASDRAVYDRAAAATARASLRSDGPADDLSSSQVIEAIRRL